jgi:hypothetical protein
MEKRRTDNFSADSSYKPRNFSTYKKIRRYTSEGKPSRSSQKIYLSIFLKVFSFADFYEAV